MIGSVLRTYGFFILRVVVPLATLPILSHWLGVSDFGVVLAMQSLALLGSLIVQYGFGVSGPRDLAQAQSDEERSRVVARVLGAQCVTSTVAAIIVAAAAAMTPMFAQNLVVIIGVVLLTLGTGLSPAWYFRGIGRAATGMGLELLGQVISLILVLVLASVRADIGSALMAIAIGPVISTVIAFVWMLARLSWSINPEIALAGETLRKSSPLFIVRASSTGFTASSAWIVGLLSSPEQAAFFGVAAKLVGAITSLSQPITFTMLPDISRRMDSSPAKAVGLAVRWGLVLLAIALTAIIAVYLFGDFAIGLLFASDMAPAAELTKLLSWICVLVALRETQSDLILVPLRKDNAIAAGVVFGGLVGVGSALVLVPANGAFGMVLARILAEATIAAVMTACLIYLRRPRLHGRGGSK